MLEGHQVGRNSLKDPTKPCWKTYRSEKRKRGSTPKFDSSMNQKKIDGQIPKW